MRNSIAIAAMILVCSAAVAQPAKPSTATRASTYSMERYEGGSVVTDLGHNIKLNKHSTLKREWFVVRDENSPIAIEGSAGNDVTYKSGERYSSGQYQYQMMYLMKPREPITAFEVRVIVLDIFGRPAKTLTVTELIDLTDSKPFDGTWRIWSENEASEAYASVVYVAQVRTASGRVYEADRAAVFDQARKVNKRITEADLEAKRDSPPKP